MVVRHVARRGQRRELNRLCEHHVAYRWICGGVSMNYHTLSDFRTQHVELLDRLLTESVASLMAEGLVTLDRVAQDGMKVRASAGAASFRRQPTLEEALAEAEEQLPQLKKELEADPAARTTRQQAARQRAAEERAERIRAALEQLPKIAEGKKAEGPRQGAGLDDRCRQPGDEDGRRRVSPGIQRAIGHGHRFADHHRRGRDQLRRRPGAIGADGRAAPRAVRGETPTKRWSTGAS